jgi:hypothetical protein
MTARIAEGKYCQSHSFGTAQTANSAGGGASPGTDHTFPVSPDDSNGIGRYPPHPV